MATGIWTLLSLGLILGFKHATEGDHVIAISSVVSRHRSLWYSGIIGLLWGLGHTTSLVVVGMVVLIVRVPIPLHVSQWFEFGVGLMIIVLGIGALRSLVRREGKLHMHRHAHDGIAHTHIHFHEGDAKQHAIVHSHSSSRVGAKPIIIGAVHGLAGSAALTLLVLVQIKSVFLGVMYLLLFGAGSAIGMGSMSILMGLPFTRGGRMMSRGHHVLQTATGCLGIVFGLWYAYKSGIPNSVF